jgi:threonine aldolase
MLHFLGGAAIAAYLAPEGARVVAACMVLVVGMKALYDYFDNGAIGLANAIALAAGSCLALGIALLVV